MILAHQPLTSDVTYSMFGTWAACSTLGTTFNGVLKKHISIQSVILETILHNVLTSPTEKKQMTIVKDGIACCAARSEITVQVYWQQCDSATHSDCCGATNECRFTQLLLVPASFNDQSHGHWCECCWNMARPFSRSRRLTTIFMCDTNTTLLPASACRMFWKQPAAVPQYTHNTVLQTY